MIESLEGKNKLVKFIDRYTLQSYDKVLVYGAGKFGMEFLHLLHIYGFEKNKVTVWDINYETIKEIYGFVVSKPAFENFNNVENTISVIALDPIKNRVVIDEIKQKLISVGYKNVVVSNDISFLDANQKLIQDIQDIIEMPIRAQDKTTVPLVSVACLTFNHAKFIRLCLGSLVIQKTNFKFEILVHDDASTDGTQEIIKEYERKFPDLVKPIYQKENQFSKGAELSSLNFARARGKYLALCEGDDYWIDENKLQIQVDFMEKNPDCSVCFHPVMVVWENEEHPNSIFPSPEIRFNKTVLELEDLLKRNFIQTNSVMYRWAFYEKKYEPYRAPDLLPGDWYLHLYHAQYGKICFIDQCMSVYRRHENGIWSGNPLVRHGIKHLRFFEEVHKNIAKDKDAYLKTVLKSIECLYKTFIDNDLKANLEYMEKHSLWSNLLLTKFKRIKQCYICKATFYCFDEYMGGSDNVSLWRKKIDCIGSDVDNFGCPSCHCHDRERHLFAYFDKLNLWPKEDNKILHFAPENFLYKKIDSCKPLEYIKADWEPELYINRGIKDVRKIDLANISFVDNYFDIVICNHVLEHIPNMQKGIAEIHRVLKKGGFAVLQTPYSKLLRKHFEDSGINTDELRNFFYGQNDHVRIVSENNFFEDLEEAGFKLDIVKHSDLFDSDFAETYGVNPKEDLIKVVKI